MGWTEWSFRGTLQKGSCSWRWHRLPSELRTYQGATEGSRRGGGGRGALRPGPPRSWASGSRNRRWPFCGRRRSWRSGRRRGPGGAALETWAGSQPADPSGAATGWPHSLPRGSTAPAARPSLWKAGGKHGSGWGGCAEEGGAQLPAEAGGWAEEDAHFTAETGLISTSVLGTPGWGDRRQPGPPTCPCPGLVGT